MAGLYSEEELTSLFGSHTPAEPDVTPSQAERPSPWRRVPDIGVMALKGAVGLAETGIGLADIPTMGAAGRALERVGVRPREAQEELSTWYSPQQRAAQAEVSEAFKEGFVPGVVSAVRHPSTIAATIGESAPSMIGGAGVARGAMKAIPAMKPWLAGALGEGVVGAGSAAEQIRQQSKTGYLSPAQLAAITASGTGTALLGAAGGRFSAKLGVGDIETALARGAVRETAAVPSKIPKSFWMRAAAGGISEGVFEELPQSAQEQMWQNYATGRPVTEGLTEAAGMGMLAGVGMGAPIGAISRPRDLTQRITPSEQKEPAVPAPSAPPGAQGSLFEAAAAAPRTMIDETLYKNLRRAGADHESALLAARRDEYGIKMREALGAGQLVEPEYRKDMEKQLLSAGADIETATIAALSTEEAKQTYSYLRGIGIKRADAIKQALVVEPIVAEPQQGALFAAVQKKTGKGPQPTFAYAGEPAAAEQKAPITTKPPKNAAAAWSENAPEDDATYPAWNELSRANRIAANKAFADLLKKGKTAEYLKAISDVQVAHLAEKAAIPEDLGGWSKAANRAIAQVNAYLSKGLLTAEQHQIHVSDLQNSKVPVSKVKKNVLSSLKENRHAVQIEKPSEGVLRAEAAQPEVKVELPGVREGYAQPQEVAREGEAQKVLVAFESKLPEQQQAIFKVLREAANDPTEWEKYVQHDFTWNATAIAEAAGVGSRKGIPTTIARLRKKLDTAAGRDVKAALAASVATKRVTEPSAYEQLGLSPAQQESVVAPEEIFGGEGLTQSMGEISSVGGSQGATSADVSGPMTQKERAIEQEARRIVREGGEPAAEVGAPVPTERGLETVREQKMADIVDAMRTNSLVESVDTWNSFAGKIPGLVEIPEDIASIELTDDNLDSLHAIVSAYMDVKQSVAEYKDAGTFFNEIGAYKHEFERIVRERAARVKEVADGGRKEARAVIAEKPGAGDVAGEAGVSTAKLVEATTKKRRVIPKPEPKASVGQETTGNTAAKIAKHLSDVFFSPVRMARVVGIVDTVEQLPEGLRKDVQSYSGRVQGLFDPTTSKVWLIANNIPLGKELSVILHEIGVHKGMENLLGKKHYDALVMQLQTWVLDGTGVKGELAVKARDRVRMAEKNMGEKLSQETFDEELIAYFVEEAVRSGIDPTAVKTQPKSMQEWFRTLWASVKAAIRRLGINPQKLTAQDVVDLAYGAARMELSSAWHGTSGGFRTFSHKYMGTGEGAQAFGWGTYLAQRRGIAEGYRKADVARKRRGVTPDTYFTYDGEKVPSSSLDATTRAKYELAVFGAGLSTRHPAAEYSRLAEAEKNRALADFYTRVSEEAAKLDISKARMVQDRRPEGHLMRVDIAIQDDELLDWDKPLNQQSEKVKTALKPRLFGPGDITGRGYYDILKMEKGSAEAASRYLDSIGIKGIKYLDQPSRSLDKSFGNYPSFDRLQGLLGNDDDLGYDTPKQAVRNILMDIARDKGERERILSHYEMSAELREEINKFLDWYEQPVVETRNLVIFNDENLHRILSHPGGEKTERRFSRVVEGPRAESKVIFGSEYLFERAERKLKQKGGYQTVRVEKLPDGRVEVTRIPLKKTSANMFSMAETEGKTMLESLAENESIISSAAKEHLRNAYNVALDKVMFTEDLVERAVRRGLSTAKEFGRLMAEKMATRDSIEQDVANIMSKAFDLGSEKAAAADFIRKSTMAQKWGYVPEWDKDIEIDPSMAREFKRLSPDAQQVVRSVFTFGNETHARLQRAVNQEIHDEFDALTAIAKTAKEKAEIETRRNDKLAQVGRIMPKLDGPYAPLKRFGNHVMVAMSKEYAEAKKNADTATMEKLQDDESHLVVEHFDTRFEAVKRVEELKPRYPGGSVETWTKQESFKHVSELPWAGIAKVRAAIEGLPENSKHKEAMQNILTDLYLSLLSETSARKSELRRKGVAGADKDMFRSFASQGAATAHFITSLENSGDIAKAITQMQIDAREGDAGTRNDRTAVLNELTSRFAQSLEYSQSPMVNRALKVTSFWMLITSPAFYIQNSMQPFMITVPYLAGRFGAARSWKEMTRAYKDISRYTLSAGAHQLNIAALPNISAAEKAMLSEMQKYGKLDLTIMQDMGRYTEGETVMDKGLFGKVMRKLWAGPQRIELLNRVASALAAYRMATGTEEQRRAYTGDVISKTHGNYSSFNAPRFFTSSGAMRLITQFRKFQLIQITLLAKLTHDAFAGADPKEKAIARRALYWTLGQSAAMTGALGLPIPAIFWAVAAALGSGDDEPEDYEQWLRNLIEDEGAANLLVRGVPAYFGVSMSQKIGMGNTFSPLPFAEIPKDKSGYEKFVTATMGAPIAVGGQWFDALNKMRKGDYYKGVEAALPSGAKNAMRGYRFATEGVTSAAGDELLSPEDVSIVDGMAQGLGLPTMKISERQRKQGVVLEADKFFNMRTTDVKHAYVKAYSEKDTAAMADAREEWKQLQNARVAIGYRRQPLSDLTRAPMVQRKRERTAVRGIETSKQNKAFVESLV